MSISIGEAYNVANDSDEIVVVYDGSTAIMVKAINTKSVKSLTSMYGKRMDLYVEKDPLKLYDFDVEYVGVDGFDDLKEGDILHYIYDADNDSALIIVARDVVKGTLTEITYDNKIKVDGKTFSVSETIVDALKDEVGKDEVGKVVVTLYLDKDGKVFKCKWEPESAPGAVYGVVQAIATRSSARIQRPSAQGPTLEGEVEYVWSEKTEDRRLH